MVYQGEVRAFHQNLYMTLPFSPFLTSSLHLTHTPSLWKRLFYFQSCSVSTRHDHVKCTSCTVSLHPFILPPPCNHLGHNVWSSNCYLAVRGECWENSRMLTRIKMLTKLGNLLSCDLYEIFIWFYHSNLVSCIRRHPKGPSNYQSHLLCSLQKFFPSIAPEGGTAKRVVPPTPVPHRVPSTPAPDFSSLHPSPQLPEQWSSLMTPVSSESREPCKNQEPLSKTPTLSHSGLCHKEVAHGQCHSNFPLISL